MLHECLTFLLWSGNFLNLAEQHPFIRDGKCQWLNVKWFLFCVSIWTCCFCNESTMYTLDIQPLKDEQSKEIILPRDHSVMKKNIWFPKVACTAKRKLEIVLQFSTLTSFVKIWSASSCEFKAYFWTFWALCHSLFYLETIGVN